MAKPIKAASLTKHALPVRYHAVIFEALMLNSLPKARSLGNACRRLISRMSTRTTSKPPSCADGPFDYNLILPKLLFQYRDRAFWESESRRLNFNAQLAGNEILCRTLGRYRMIVDARDEGLAPNLIVDGFWEIWISALIARTVQPGMVCIDAGANIGYYTVIMGDQAGPTGKVIAAEPMPETFRYLTKNIRLNEFVRNMQALNVAFGAEAGTGTFYLPKGDPKNATMSVSDGHLLDPEKFDTFQASVVPIDDLNLPRLDFVKIDVEGAERAVWNGMRATIARSPDIQIVMEVNSSRTGNLSEFLEEITQIFRLQTVDPEGYPIPITIGEILSDPQDVMLYLAR